MAWVGQCEVSVLVLDKKMRKDRLMGLEMEREKKQHVFDVAQKREAAEGHKGRSGKVKTARFKTISSQQQDPIRVRLLFLSQERECGCDTPTDQTVFFK